MKENAESVKVRGGPDPGGAAVGVTFTPLVVIELAEDAKEEAISWILHKIKDKRQDRGADLLVSRLLPDPSPGCRTGNTNVFVVGVAWERLLIGAEDVGLVKEFRDGTMRPFTHMNRTNFRDFQGEGSGFLSTAQTQYIIGHELDRLRATDESHVPGYPSVKLYPGKSIMQRLQSKGILVQIFPLHEGDKLKKLSFSWCQKLPLTFQPLEDIRQYFGESVALYFSFLEFFTLSLLPLFLLGLPCHLLSPSELHLFPPVLILLWSAVVLEVWKRRCSSLAYAWGTLNPGRPFLEPRPGFRGPLGLHPVTGRQEPVYSPGRRLLKVALVSVPAVLLGLFLALGAMAGYLCLEAWVQEEHVAQPSTWSGMLLLLPGVLYAIVIEMMNRVFRCVVELLAHWENHRLESSHQNHLMLRVLVFTFLSRFSSLFYIAFVEQDMAHLKQSLATLLITSQILNQMGEAFLPYWLQKRRNQKVHQRAGQASGTGWVSLDQELPLPEKVRVEANMNTYLGTSDEYLELFVLFGYVSLFSCVCPLAVVFVVLNNATELYSDALKMCRVFKRPFSQPAANIGIWQLAFEAMTALAVVTNCALIGISSEVKAMFTESETQRILLVLAVEHFLLALKLILAFVIPDVPKEIRTQLARVEYESKEALKKKKAQETKETEKKGMLGMEECVASLS